MRALVVLSLLYSGAALGAELKGRVLRGGEPVANIAVLVSSSAPTPPAAIARLQEVELTFLPKVQVVPVGSSLRVRNVDHEAHTVHGALAGRTLFNRATVPGGAEAILSLDAPGIVAITCDLHSYMRAWVIVTASPHHAITNSDGTFRIPGIPPDRAEVRLVDPDVKLPAGQEPGVLVATVEVADKPVQLTLALPPKATDLSGQAPRNSTDLSGGAAAARGPRDRDSTDLSEGAAAARGSRDRDSSDLSGRAKGARPAVPRWFRGISLEHSFPSSAFWVLALSALGIIVGTLAAVFNLSLRGRLGWSMFGALLSAVALIFLFGISFLLGLHPAVAAGLGFGAFCGTVVFAAREEPRGGGGV